MNKHHLTSVDQERLFAHITNAAEIFGASQNGERNFLQRRRNGQALCHSFARSIVRNNDEGRTINESHVRWLAALLADLCDELE